MPSAALLAIFARRARTCAQLQRLASPRLKASVNKAIAKLLSSGGSNTNDYLDINVKLTLANIINFTKDDNKVITTL